MLNIVPPPYRRNRSFKPTPKAPSPPAPPPGPPNLVSAVYDPGAVPVPTVTLVFDRAIDVSSYDGTEIILYDEPNGCIYDGSWGDSLVDPVTLLVQLSLINSGEGSQVLLDADVSCGILDVVSGEPWVGCSDLVLPFP